MPLDTGRYHIYTKDGHVPVGRKLNDDRTIGAKGIYMLLEYDAPPVWEVEKLGNGQYKFKTHPADDFNGGQTGAPVGSGEGHLWAFAKAERPSEVWSLKPNLRDGPNSTSYVVTNAKGAGWAVGKPGEERVFRPDQEPVQVTVNNLIIFPTQPASYPLNEIFVFEKLN